MEPGLDSTFYESYSQGLKMPEPLFSKPVPGVQIVERGGKIHEEKIKEETT